MFKSTFLASCAVAMLAGGAVPSEPFASLEALAPAREFTNRHASIMLAWDAAAEAAGA